MSTMDFKVKGRAWVGNIYQKFEAMCQDVDDIVRQDHVKYVENHVQTVGETVKKFCSDVVQDLLPPLVDPVKCEVQAVSLKQNASIGTYIKSMIGIEENPEDIDVKRSSVEFDAIDAVKNRLGHASSFSGCHLLNECIPAPSLDPIKGVESNISSGKDENVSAHKESDAGIEESATKDMSFPSEELELLAPTEKDLCEESLFSESINENHENTCGILTEVSPVTSVHGEGFKAPQKVGTSCPDFVNEYEGVSDVSSTLPSSELDLSLVSSESKVTEMGLISSRSSLSGESYSHYEIPPVNFPKKSGKICIPVDAMVCVSDISSAALCSESSLIVSCDNNIAEMQFASSSSILTLDSNDVDTSRMNEELSLLGPHRNRHEQGWESAQLESFMSSSEIGRSDDSEDDIADPGMETIELCDKLKLEESCVIVDGNVLHAVSHRARKLRSYKKIIRDAFGSKKRIAKEYEQLAIIYGDIDTEFSEHTAQNLLPSIPTSSSDLKKLPRHELCDSEWELL